MSKEILLTGSNGALGTAFLAAGKDRGDKIYTPQYPREFDITNYDSCLRTAEDKTLDVVVHLAALTYWEKCHQDPQAAFAVNTQGVLNMARIALLHNARFIFISTDAVFAEANPNHLPFFEFTPTGIPNNTYGLTKLMGELTVRMLAQNGLRYLIARGGWFFGPNPHTDVKFVGAILRQMAEGQKTIRAVTDQTGTLTYTPHFAQKLFNLIDDQAEGIRHAFNNGAVTRYDVAKYVVKLWQAQATVEPALMEHFPSPVVRPKYTVLGTKFRDCLLPSWQDALADYHHHYPDIKAFKK